MEECLLKREQHKDPDVKEYIKNSSRSINKLIIQGVMTKRKHVSTCQDSEYVTSTYNIMNKIPEERFYSKHTLKGKK